MNRLNQLLLTGLVAASLVAGWNPCFADGPTVVRIEEDWELVVNQPDPATFSPQITFYLSPTVESESVYFRLQLNYAADQDVSPGGFHVAAVEGETVVDEERSDVRATLSQSNDRIRWTNVMAHIDSRLYFAVKDGFCHEWGVFGGPEYLVQMPAGDVQDLSMYRAQQSLDNVDIGFGANRVARIELRAVRLYFSDGMTLSIPLEWEL